MSIVLTPEVIEFYKDAVLNPSKYNLNKMRPLSECFQPSEVIVALHLLFEAYNKNENHKVPKVIFYMVFEEMYGQVQGKDANGYAGYYLSFKEK